MKNSVHSAALGLVVASAAVAIAAAAPAAAGSSGMAAEFPVGTCIDYQNNHLNIDTQNLLNVTAVSCTAPGRDYRVAEHVANFTRCNTTTTDFFYTSRDLVVLCVVNDQGSDWDHA